MRSRSATTPATTSCRHRGRALSAVRALDGGAPVALVLPNPDLVYPKGGGGLGVTAGSAALVIETGSRGGIPGRGLAFAALGKPEPGHVRSSRGAGSASRRPLMVGDQLETDIAGALTAGIDAALVDGVSRWTDAAAITPTWLLPSLVA